MNEKTPRTSCQVAEAGGVRRGDRIRVPAGTKVWDWKSTTTRKDAVAEVFAVIAVDGLTTSIFGVPEGTVMVQYFKKSGSLDLRTALLSSVEVLR